MNYYLGADLGTSALKLLLVDQNGTIVNTVSRSYPVFYPKSGWSEQNPEDWWRAFLSGVDELTQNIDKTALKGIGFGGQMHGLVALDRNDEVLRPAILWNDGRTEKEVEYLNRVVSKERLSKLTGNIAFAGFTAPKLLWMQKNEPELFRKIEKIMLPKDYMNYRLTGVHSTDYSDASGTLLFDVENKCWSKEMLEICNLKETQMPELFESYEVIGRLNPAIADALGLSADVIVVAGGGDNAVSAIGTGTVEDGLCNISLGTSGTVFISCERFSVPKQNALHSFCHANGKYHLMGCILSAASCNRWFCEEILDSNDYAALQAPIAEDNLGNNSVFFLPYLMGERSPINDTDARGAFLGLSMDTARADLVQAVLEGVAFAIKDNLEIARLQGIEIRRSTLCGGGAKSALWQKILCNVLDLEISLPQTEQGPGYGGAMLSMVAAGEYASVEECSKRFVQTKTTLHPDRELAARYQRQYEKYKEIYPTLKNLFKKLK